MMAVIDTNVFLAALINRTEQVVPPITPTLHHSNNPFQAFSAALGCNSFATNPVQPV